MANHEWAKNDTSGSVIESLKTTVGLWARCTEVSTGHTSCDHYDNLLLGSVPILGKFSLRSFFEFWMIEIILIKITHDEILVLEKSWSRYQLPEINYQLLINYFKWFILDFSRCKILLRPFPNSWHNRSCYFPYWHVLYSTWINPRR